MEELNLANCGLQKVEELSNLINLKVLDLTNNKITNLDCLKNLYNLETLTINTNPLEIENLYFLKDLESLKTLTLDFQTDSFEKMENLLKSLAENKNLKIELKASWKKVEEYFKTLNPNIELYLENDNYDY